MSISESFEEALQKLKRFASWRIFCHENPDGDTLGCALALYSLGKRIGKDVRVISKDPLPETYSFLPYSEELCVAREYTEAGIGGALLIAVDISTDKRSLVNFQALLSCCADSVAIDHHCDNSCFAATNIVAGSASATAEIVTDIIEAYGCGITKEEACLLYTALVTDNGNFRFSSTSAASHKCAARLLEAGADPSFIDDRINENMTECALRLWGLALSRTEVFAGGRCALFWLRFSEMEEAACGPGALEGLVNMLLRIKGVKMAMFLCERADANKLSVRSRAPYSSRELAAVFGGGGHAGAAGAVLPLPFEEAISGVRKEAEKLCSSRESFQ